MQTTGKNIVIIDESLCNHHISDILYIRAKKNNESFE